MKAIVTVLGKDRVGIMAKVCGYLAEKNVNILDVSQTIIKEYFDMIMIVDVSGLNCSFAEFTTDLDLLGKEIGLMIRAKKEEIFKSMYRV